MRTAAAANCRVIFLALFSLLELSCCAQEPQDIYSDGTGMRARLDSMNSRRSSLFLQKDADALVEHYDAGLTYYPEYKPAIFSRAALHRFFRDWFSQGDIRSCQKDICKVEVFDSCILEIGTFEMGYTAPGTNQAQEYKGKYMTIWKTGGGGRLAILSEAFSADRYVGPEDMPYAAVNVKETNVAPDYGALDPSLLAEIEKQNDDVISAVVRGSGPDRASGFADDGIYMPHFDTILAGMSAIRPYMLKTYHPEAKFRVKHHFYRIFDFGNIVLINGHFDGGWGNEKDGGVFTGNMSSLLRRGQGRLLMYCQLPNNDQKIVSFKR